MLTPYVVCFVIPTYNRYRFAKDTIQSCLGQEIPTSWAIQVIVVDDGSTDDTTQRLSEDFKLQRKSDDCYQNDQVCVLRIPNSERGAARNQGIKLAMQLYNPDWFIFLDADDVIAPGALKKVLPQIQKGDQIISTKYLLWNGNETYGKPAPATPNRPAFDAYMWTCPLALGTTFVSKDIIEKVHGFKEDRQLAGSEDWIFLLMASYFAEPRFLSDVLVWYRRHEGNTAPERTEKSISAARKEIKKFLSDKISARHITTFDLTADLMIIGAYNSANLTQKAFHLCLRCIRANPLRFWFRGTRTLLSIITKKFGL